MCVRELKGSKLDFYGDGVTRVEKFHGLDGRRFADRSMKVG